MSAEETILDLLICSPTWASELYLMQEENMIDL